MAPSKPALVGISIAATAALALSMTGCGSPQEEQMSPQEARDTLVQLIEDTSAQLDIEEWAPLGDPLAGGCSEGTSISWLLAASPGTDFAGDAQTVADYWEGLGIDVRIQEEPDYVVYGTGGPISAISFSTAPGNYGISGTSVCVPGEPEDADLDNG